MTSDASLAMTGDRPRLSALDAQKLIQANINPRTGLATDYLNHFNEAIMLLELMASFPDCQSDFLAWQPKTYTEHFGASRLKDRDIAIAAYEATDPAVRARLEKLCATMMRVIAATRDAMRTHPGTMTETLAAQVASMLRPLVAQAGAVINGTESPGAAPQSTVDALMQR